MSHTELWTDFRLTQEVGMHCWQFRCLLVYKHFLFPHAIVHCHEKFVPT